MELAIAIRSATGSSRNLLQVAIRIAGTVLTTGFTMNSLGGRR
jgi:hypothetical protein